MQQRKSHCQKYLDHQHIRDIRSLCIAYVKHINIYETIMLLECWTCIAHKKGVNQTKQLTSSINCCVAKLVKIKTRSSVKPTNTTLPSIVASVLFSFGKLIGLGWIVYVGLKRIKF